EGVRTGGENQCVVGDLAARRGDDPLGRAVDDGDGLAQVGHDELVAVVGVAVQRQRIPLPRTDIGGQSHPVVGRFGLLADDLHAPGGVDVALAQLLDEAVPDHAVAHHDDGVAARVGFVAHFFTPYA